MAAGAYSVVLLIILQAEFLQNAGGSSAHGHATEEDFQRLHSKLLTNYSRHVRPIANQSAAVEVKLDFSLLSIFDVDDVKQQISVMALVNVQWHDKNLKWNPIDYGGIDRMFFSEKQIWAPSVYVESGHNSVKLFDLPTQHYVRYDGTVMFVSAGNMFSPCSLDLTVFPYDSQNCRFGFGLLDSSVAEVKLTPGHGGVTKSKGFVEDGEWKVFDTAIDVTTRHLTASDVEFGTVYAVLKIQRRSTFYIINIIIPALTIAMLSLLTFAVPVESGERLAYALTILLSLSVYITYIGSFMPMASVNMPIVFYFLLGLFLISSMCVVMTVMVIAIRWSHVVLVEDLEKTILIFGFPFRIKRRSRHRRHSFGFTCCPSEDVAYKRNSDATASECISVWSSDRHGSWDWSSPQASVEEARQGENKNQSSQWPWIAGAEEQAVGVQTKPVMNEKQQLQFEEDQAAAKRIRKKMEESGHDVKADADIMYICSRLNMYSFLILFFSFIGMTCVMFLQLRYHVV